MRQKIYNYHWLLGLVIMLFFWWVNWTWEGLRTHWAFFPMWLGYIILADGIVYLRKGTSILSRSRLIFFLLFIVSIPLWWLFEAINERTQYWIYSSNDQFTDLEYAFFATLSFSTVVPAVIESSELVLSFFKSPQKAWIRYGNRKWQITFFFILGWLMLLIVLLFPIYGMAFIWMSLFFILDPINYWIGNNSILEKTGQGYWRLVWVLWLGVLICGFLWEMWNFYSFPKWYYTIPGVNFWYVFEMPLVGYLGYLPFALEIYSFYYFFSWLFRLPKDQDLLNV